MRGGGDIMEKAFAASAIVCNYFCVFCVFCAFLWPSSLLLSPTITHSPSVFLCVLCGFTSSSFSSVFSVVPIVIAVSLPEFVGGGVNLGGIGGTVRVLTSARVCAGGP